MVDLITALTQLVDDFVDRLKKSTVGLGVRTIEDEPSPEEYGPIVAYLVEQGYLSDPRERDVSQTVVRRQLDNVPDSAWEAAVRAQRQATGETMDYNEFISIGLDKCGSDKRTFSKLAELWSKEKDLIRGMTESELRNDLDCP